MALSLLTALKILAEPEQYNATAVMSACDAVVRKRAKLRYRVWVKRPRGVSPVNPEWMQIRKAAVPACVDWSEIFIEPVGFRTAYSPSERLITVGPGMSVHLKWAGSQNMAALSRFYVMQALGVAVHVWDPLNWDAQVLENPIAVQPLAQVATNLETGLAVVTRGLYGSEGYVPLLRYEQVDVDAGIVEIRLDRDIEAFEPTPAETAKSKVVAIRVLLATMEQGPAQPWDRPYYN